MDSPDCKMVRDLKIWTPSNKSQYSCIVLAQDKTWQQNFSVVEFDLVLSEMYFGTNSARMSWNAFSVTWWTSFVIIFAILSCLFSLTNHLLLKRLNIQSSNMHRLTRFLHCWMLRLFSYYITLVLIFGRVLYVYYLYRPSLWKH